MKEEDIKALKNTIWTTRVSRINAERRLNSKISFTEGINIYYSIVTINLSIVSLLRHDDNLSLVSVLMTIALLITILYLKSLQYSQHAIDYRKNYTELHSLELELDDISPSDIEKLQRIKESYSKLMYSSSNHTPYDFYCTVNDSTDKEYREKYWKKVKWRFIRARACRFMVKLILVIAPLVAVVLVEVLKCKLL